MNQALPPYFPTKLILVDPKLTLCKAWEIAFADHPEVSMVQGYFEELPEYDCMVSAANSFGLMDGGVDLAIINYFGPSLQHRVQQYILEHYLGEQPVGTSFLLTTQHPKHPYLAHTPTMRIPTPIHRTDAVYLAMRAMLLAVIRHNEKVASDATKDTFIQTIACPGLGTAAGKMPPKEAARQMAIAYQTIKQPPLYLNWQLAQKRQLAIRYGGNPF